jgi:endonuclease/exonuclease/phosphatase family metal-dependent hydrolase
MLRNFFRSFWRGQILPPPDIQTTGFGNLRLATYNVAHGRGLSLYQGLQSKKTVRRNLSSLAAFLRSLDADIIALQEVDEYSHWNQRVNLLRLLQEETQYPFAAMSAHNVRRSHKPLIYGNGILSYIPLTENTSLPFGSRQMGEKGFQYIEFSFARRTLPLVNLHLDFQSRENRVRQISQVIEYLEERGKDPFIDPPMICGDFNTTTAQARDAVRTLFKSLRQQERYSIHPRNKNTFPSFFPRRALDFIFLPAPYRPIQTQVIRTLESDHLPVVVDFQVPL